MKAGDTLRVTATYDTSRASWYESMGIMVVWMADGTDGRRSRSRRNVDDAGRAHPRPPPRERQPRWRPTRAVRRPGDAARWPPRRPIVDIRDFVYASGDMERARPDPHGEGGPVAHASTTSTRRSTTASGTRSRPARRRATASTGIAYPLADADVTFDSGELGLGGPPTANRVDVDDAGRPGTRHLHLLLPDPPVHARCVPRSRLGEQDYTSRRILPMLASASM